MPRRESHLGRFDKGTEALIGIHLKGQSDFLGKVTGGRGKVRKSYGGRSQKAVTCLKKEGSATAQEIIDHCRQRLTSFQVPKRVEFTNKLPRDIVYDKINRLELIRTYSAQQQ